MRIVAIGLAVVLVAGAGVDAYIYYDLTSSFTADAVELEGQGPVPPDIGEIEGGVDILIAGTDECEPEFAGYFGDRCTGPDSEGTLNDVNMLVRSEEHTSELQSLMRI